MCSGTFNNPSMKLLVIRDAIPDTPDLITHPPCCCLVSYSRSALYLSLYLYLFLFLTLSLFLYLLRAIHASLFLYKLSLRALFFSSRNVSPGFHALFISTVIVDNVVESENNISVVASLYCDVVTIYLCRFGGVTIVEA